MSSNLKMEWEKVFKILGNNKKFESVIPSNIEAEANVDYYVRDWIFFYQFYCHPFHKFSVILSLFAHFLIGKYNQIIVCWQQNTYNFPTVTEYEMLKQMSQNKQSFLHSINCNNNSTIVWPNKPLVIQKLTSG